MSCLLLLLHRQQHRCIQAPTTRISAPMSDPGSAEYKEAFNQLSCREHLRKDAEGWVKAEGDNEHQEMP